MRSVTDGNTMDYFIGAFRRTHPKLIGLLISHLRSGYALQQKNGQSGSGRQERMTLILSVPRLAITVSIGLTLEKKVMNTNPEYGAGTK